MNEDWLEKMEGMCPFCGNFSLVPVRAHHTGMNETNGFSLKKICVSCGKDEFGIIQELPELHECADDTCEDEHERRR